MIEIYATIDGDIDKMDFNQWAHEIKNAKGIKALKKYCRDENTVALTLFDRAKEKPVAILAFHQFAQGMVEGMIAADKCFGDNPKYAVKMKWLIGQVIKDHQLQMVITISEDVKELNKWHNFLGFKELKKLPKYRNNTNFILWGML